MTREASSALDRRGFLKSAGALVVAFSTLRREGLAQFATTPLAGSPDNRQLDSWLAIAADGTVTAFSGKEELGQGISTAQQQLVAEELCVAFDRVHLIYGDTALTPDQAYTSGSQSHPANFRESNLALACATAREALVGMASRELGVPAGELRTADGAISGGGRTIAYGDLIGGKKLKLALNPGAKRRHPREWTVLGKPIGRTDMAAMATGQFEYVHNVRVPGMLHGCVVRPPAPGASVVSVDEGSVKDVDGLVKVVVRKNFVGVVARKPWQARLAANRLKVEWTRGAGLPAHADFYAALRKQPSRDVLLVDSKDTSQTLAGARTVLRATYNHPYQMHGSVGASCAVADVRGGKATLYSASQGVWYQKTAGAMLLGLKPEDVHVIFRRGSGCYGLNGADAVSYDALVLSHAVEQPVRVQFSRQDEMAWENFGNAWSIDERAGLNEQGDIVAWEHEAWTPSRGNRPGPSTPGNIVSGNLLGFEPAAFSPGPPQEPRNYNNGSNGVPSYVAGRVGGKESGTGTVKSEKVLVHNLQSAFWTGPLRSPARLQNTFAHESFMDELAAHVKADPVEYRLRHLRSERVIGVLKAAAQAARWEHRPSPRPGISRTGVATGRGVACVAYEGDNGYTGIVVDVEVNQGNGKVSVKRIWVAIDAGPISNPDGLRNQAEGGALQGMSRALGEEVTWDAGKVTSVDWRTYHSLPLGFALPQIECVLVNRPDDEATGAGETSITVMAAAIGNAVFDATGARLRQIPFTSERVLAALQARG